jgi:undecaprenyl pyrophosphate synthase
MDSELVKIPVHLGLIIDGNGRWAKSRGLTRSMGHKAGFDNLETILKECFYTYGIKCVSVYCFSTENWNRPEKEVDYLRSLFRKMVDSKMEKKYPDVRINFMGEFGKFGEDIEVKGKALMEKTIIAKARMLGEGAPTTICLTRYGNVMGSRGSVIPLFYKLIREGKPITVTDPNMTRYMMTLEQAVKLVMFAFENGNQGDLFVQKAPGATIQTLADAVKKYKNSDVETKIIGTRHGEKDHEVLVTREEMTKAEDMGDYFRVPMDNRDLNYDNFYPNGDGKVKKIEAYTSNNTHQLDVDGMVELLKEMGEIEE